MSTWKKVLTTDDLSTGSGSNLGTSNLDQSDNSRSYKIRTLGSDPDRLLEFTSVFGSSDSAVIPLLQLNAVALTHEVYLSAAHGVYIGVNGSTRYKLPLANTCSAGKFMVGSSTTTSVFDTVDQVLKPGGSGLFHPENDAVNVGEDVVIDEVRDSVLLYNKSESKFVHVTAEQLAAASSVKRTTLLFGLTTASNGSFFLKGVNGVQHTATLGFVAPRNCTIVGGSLCYIKPAGSSGFATSKRIRVFVDSSATLPFGAGYVGAGFNAGSVITKAYDESDISTVVNIAKGDVVSVEIQTASASGTNNSQLHQVVLELE